jgi:polyvinyl alcohol dehydrogenase (cytochrome)
MNRRAAFGALTVALLCCALSAPTSATAGPRAASGSTVAGRDSGPTAGQDGGWTMAGQNIGNTRDAAGERTISPANVAKLHVKWSLTTNGSVFDTPAVSDGVVYITDHGSTTLPSTLWAIRARTGQVIWSRSISSYTGISGDVSRATPTLTHGMLILGDTPEPFNGGPWLFAVSAATGNLVWKTHLDSHPAAIDTTSPVVYGSRVIVGVSSYEEGLAGEPGYACCTFRGSLMSLDIRTGRVLWKTYMVPDNGGQPGGYSGVAVWGSTPVVDPRNGMVYVATGNTYTVPAGVCTSPTDTDCAQPVSDDYSDSILALSLATGAVIWAHPTLEGDVFTTACTDPGEECGPDFDFGSGPNLFTVTMPDGAKRQLLGAGQKSGVYYALDPETGQTVWQTKVGPGTEYGGIQWGSATDGNRVYVAESDLAGVPYKVNGQTISAGSWAALNAATGAIEWQIPDPQGAADLGFMSVANGVVYAPSLASTGPNMYALNAATGAILWRFASGGSVVAGAAIVDGTVYWGSGYYYYGSANNKLYAFSL